MGWDGYKGGTAFSDSPSSLPRFTLLTCRLFAFLSPRVLFFLLLFLPIASRLFLPIASQRGAFQLDRDVRALVAFLSAASATTARSSFARLSQVVALLSLERESEVFDIWTPPAAAGIDSATGSGGLRWKLNATEVRQVLALRVDFRKEVIAQLKL
jgi:hypothetical protein